MEPQKTYQRGREKTPEKNRWHLSTDYSPRASRSSPSSFANGGAAANIDTSNCAASWTDIQRYRNEEDRRIKVLHSSNHFSSSAAGTSCSTVRRTSFSIAVRSFMVVFTERMTGNTDVQGRARLTRLCVFRGATGNEGGANMQSRPPSKPARSQEPATSDPRAACHRPTENETPHSSVIMATRAQPRTALAAMIAFGAGVTYILWRRARSMGVSTLALFCRRKHTPHLTPRTCADAILLLHCIFVYIELNSASIWTTQVLTSLVSNSPSIQFLSQQLFSVSFGYNTPDCTIGAAQPTCSMDGMSFAF